MDSLGEHHLAVLLDYLDKLGPLARVKADAAWRILVETAGTETAIAMMEYFIQQNDWAPIEAKNFADPCGFDVHKLVEWAQSLPERDETVEIYRKVGVDLGDDITDPAERIEWMESLPTGWKSDQTLFVYVAKAHVGDSAEVERALDLISDSRTKAEALEIWKRTQKERKK